MLLPLGYDVVAERLEYDLYFILSITFSMISIGEIPPSSAAKRIYSFSMISIA